MRGLNTPHKEEFPPIFPGGFYRMSLGDLRKKCVDAFPQSARRKMIMDGLQRMFDRLIAAGLDESELWVDGSFVTVKEEPDDVDLLLIAPARFLDNGTPEQVDLLEAFDDNVKKNAFRTDYHCDTHSVLMYPEGSSLSVLSEGIRLQFEQDFGRSYITREPKGIATVAVVQPKLSAQEAGA